jgi:hypothetical protein
MTERRRELRISGLAQVCLNILPVQEGRSVSYNKLGLLIEGHGTGRIVVDELIEELVAHLAHWSEEAQPKILGCHVA